MRTLVLIVVAVACGSFANFFLPSRIPWVEDWGHHVENRAREAGIQLVDAAQARAIVDEGAHIVLDARALADYDESHLPGAMSMPSATVDESFDAIVMFLVPDQPIMTYCSGVDCDESLHITEYLREQGFTNIVLFAGGMHTWNEQGHPVE